MTNVLQNSIKSSIPGKIQIQIMWPQVISIGPPTQLPDRKRTSLDNYNSELFGPWPNGEEFWQVRVVHRTVSAAMNTTATTWTKNRLFQVQTLENDSAHRQLLPIHDFGQNFQISVELGQNSVMAPQVRSNFGSTIQPNPEHFNFIHEGIPPRKKKHISSNFQTVVNHSLWWTLTSNDCLHSATNMSIEKKFSKFKAELHINEVKMKFLIILTGSNTYFSSFIVPKQLAMNYNAMWFVYIRAFPPSICFDSW